VELFYGEMGSVSSIALNNCKNGKENCSVSLNLDSLYGKNVIYWFVVRDIADNIVNSSRVKVFVDDRKPVINSIDYEFNGKEYDIDLNVSEDNFQKAVYFDSSGKEKLFCSSLKKGICSRKLKLSENIVFRIVDRAGNFEEREFAIN